MPPHGLDAMAIPAEDLLAMEAEMPEVVAAIRDVMQARRERNAGSSEGP